MLAAQLSSVAVFGPISLPPNALLHELVERGWAFGELFAHQIGGHAARDTVWLLGIRVLDVREAVGTRTLITLAWCVCVCAAVAWFWSDTRRGHLRA